ncbi:DUF6464 family protein [Vasconcelosia minhoensis]|uniref:DUF6464 family protein n=1 Tax=Vasconcelosia minhoensis TaxID=3366354 RepID=UPI001D13965A|nr:DUF6464 family protein [Romeria gracilis]
MLIAIVVVIFLIGLLPPLLSAWVSLRNRQQIQVRLNLVVETAVQQRCLNRPAPDHRYVDGLGLVVGDISCEHNARSPYLRCAVNPLGPCEDCRDYAARPEPQTAQSRSLADRPPLPG